MPNDLAVQALTTTVHALTPGSSSAPVTPGVGVATIGAASIGATGVEAASHAVAPAPLFASPTLRIDADLHILVMEFHDRAGNIVASVPTERQLEAYRLSALESAPSRAAAGSTATSDSSAQGRLATAKPGTVV